MKKQHKDREEAKKEEEEGRKRRSKKQKSKKRRRRKRRSKLPSATENRQTRARGGITFMIPPCACTRAPLQAEPRRTTRRAGLCDQAPQKLKTQHPNEKQKSSLDFIPWPACRPVPKRRGCRGCAACAPKGGWKGVSRARLCPVCWPPPGDPQLGKEVAVELARRARPRAGGRA